MNVWQTLQELKIPHPNEKSTPYGLQSTPKLTIQIAEQYLRAGIYTPILQRISVLVLGAPKREHKLPTKLVFVVEPDENVEGTLIMNNWTTNNF